MKNKTFILIIILITLNACSLTKKAISKKSDLEAFNKYLLCVINDTTLFEIPAIKIIDDNIYPILDSVISSTKQCEYFNDRIPYLHAFQFTTSTINDEIGFSIYNRLSYEEALGISFSRIIGEEITISYGVFYYKNYLFTIFLEDVDKTYSFCERAGFKYNLTAPKLFRKEATFSYLSFVKRLDQYLILEDNACKPPIRR